MMLIRSETPPITTGIGDALEIANFNLPLGKRLRSREIYHAI